MINILIAGDFHPCLRVKELINQNLFDDVFGQTHQILKKMDYSIVNLESPILIDNAKPIKKTGPNIKSTRKTIDALKYAGFKCITLANNHFYDYGEIGVKNTIDTCKDLKIDIIGGGKNLNEAKQILYKTIKNKRFAFINFCENEWTIATQIQGGSSPLNIIDNYYQIKEAKENADYVIVIIHGGVEHYQLPTPKMKETYRFFADIGADIIVNHHQHCYSGFENYNDKLIFYGIGNFSFDINSIEDEKWNTAFFVNIEFNEDTDKISFNLIPFSQGGPHSLIDFNINHQNFYKDINDLNNIISNDELLLKSFDELAKKKGDILLTLLEPFRNKYLFFLRNKKIIPSFYDSKSRMLLLNLFRCESHREIMLNSLNNNLKK